MADVPTLTRYRVDFERIGRRRDVAPLEVAAPAAGELADEVAEYARRYLGSRFFVVVVDLEQMTGRIEGGRFGTFTISSLEDDRG